MDKREDERVTQRSEQRARAIGYLLDGLSEDEREKIDQELLSNEEAFEQMTIAEDDLIDDYLSEALTAEERRRFEKAYLVSPERRERVEFARVLRKRLREGPRVGAIPRVPARAAQWSPFLLAAAALVLAVIGAYFAVDSARARQELRRLEAEKAVVSRRERDLERQIAETRGQDARLSGELARERAEKERLAQELTNLQARSAKTVSFTLLAGLVRDSGTLQTLRIPSDATTVRLTLPLSDASYPSYRAVIQTPEGKHIWKGAALRTEGGSRQPLAVTLPAGLLSPGDYILSVTGITPSGRPEPAADFSFRVANR